MYRFRKPRTTSLTVNTSYVAERLEQKIGRIMNNKEPIKDGAPMIYTERKDGVRPELDIRTDKWEIAAGAMDAVSRARLAKSMANPNTKTEDSAATVTVQNKEGGESKAQSAEGTQPKNTENPKG